MDDYNVKFGSSSNTFKSRKNKLLNTVRFKCFLSFKARGEKKETGEERRRQEERRRDETGGERRREEEELFCFSNLH